MNHYSLKIEGQRKLTRCGFGSHAQPTQVVYGSEVPYHSCCFGWANWATVAHFHFGPFLAIFQMALAPKIYQV